MGRWRWQRVVAVVAVTAATVVALPAVADAVAEYQYVRSDGAVASSPSLAATPEGELYLVVRGTDDSIYLSRSIFWPPWESLGAPPGGAKGDPSLVSPGSGQLTLYVRGADNKLWHRSRSAVGTWGNWLRTTEDGELKSAPRASVRSPGRVDIFVMGTDDRVYQRCCELLGFTTGQWIPLGEPDGPVGLVGEPTAASHDGTEVALFARGTDNKLWGRVWNGNVWSPWAMVVTDGVLNSSPYAVSNGRGGVVVFVRGTDNNLYSIERGIGGAWGGWVRESLTGNNAFQDNPTASILPSGHIDAAVRGTNNIAYTYVYRF